MNKIGILKKAGSLALAAALSVTLAACGPKTEQNTPTDDALEGTINIYLPMGRKRKLRLRLWSTNI